MLASSAQKNGFHLSLREKAVFTRQFSALIHAGLPITRALMVTEKQSQHQKLQDELNKILRDLEQGVSLSQSFRRWDPLMLSLLKAGEAGGMMGEVLERLARFYEAQFKLQSRVMTTMTYPLIILVVSLLIFVAMIVFILPQFSAIYTQLGADLPAYTQFWIDVSEAIRSPLAIIGVFVVVGIFYFLLQNKDTYATVLQRFLMPIPLIGSVLVHTLSARFARTLGTLLRCGVSLTESIQIAGNPLYPIAHIQAQLSDGVPLNQVMKNNSRVFPVLLTEMVAVGEETGELNQLLLKSADIYDQELEDLLNRLTAFIEPAIIILIGGLIGSVVMGMYLPMFQVFELIG